MSKLVVWFEISTVFRVSNINGEGGTSQVSQTVKNPLAIQET